MDIDFAATKSPTPTIASLDAMDEDLDFKVNNSSFPIYNYNNNNIILIIK